MDKAAFLGGHAIQYACKATDECQQCGACGVEKMLANVVAADGIQVVLAAEVAKVAGDGPFTVELKATGAQPEADAPPSCRGRLRRRSGRLRGGEGLLAAQRGFLRRRRSHRRGAPGTGGRPDGGTPWCWPAGSLRSTPTRSPPTATGSWPTWSPGSIWSGQSASTETCGGPRTDGCRPRWPLSSAWAAVTNGWGTCGAPRSAVPTPCARPWPPVTSIRKWRSPCSTWTSRTRATALGASTSSAAATCASCAPSR